MAKTNLPPQEDNDDPFNLTNTEASSYLADRAKSDDGLLRPKLEEGKDGKRELVIRLLPNFTKEGKIKSTAIEKHIHYAKFEQNPELQGYFDCLKNTDIGKDCPLCKTFWALKNTKDPKDEEKAKLISRSTKYYAYAYVVEDKQKPENQGKIFIFPYGFKIYQKIKAMANARKPCTVEDLVYGANLVLVIEEVGGFYNYDGSYFEAPEPLSIDGVPIEVAADGTIPAAERTKVKEFLLSRSHDLEEWRAKDWTPEQREKADKIIALLSGQSFDAGVSDVTYGNKKDNTKALTSSQIFSTEDDEDSTPAAKTPVKAEAAKAKKAETPVEPVKSADVTKAANKAAAFFDDEDN